MGTRITRILRIMKMLQDEGALGVDAIATRTGVSRRTVFRDIQSLRKSGVPIKLSHENHRSSCAVSIPTTSSIASERFDLELLEATAGGSSNDHPLPPEFFGPLWPFGEPEGRPKEEPVEELDNQQLLLEFTVPGDATDEEVEALLRETAERASALHIAHGGAGLVVDDLQIYSPAKAPEPAGAPA